MEIECLPADIPSHIDLDVSGLNFGDVLRVADLPHSGASSSSSPTKMRLSPHVTAIKEEVAPEADAVAAAARAGRTRSREEGQAGDRGSSCAADKEGGEEVSLGGRYRARCEQRGPAKVLVVGLGNPGIEYQFTPHNAGFLAIDRIAERCTVQW